MRTKKIALTARLFLALLLCMSGVTTVKAQPATGTGIDPNAQLLMNFENGSIAEWTTNTINRGEKVSVELMDSENGDPVRFGRYAVKLNWDFTAADAGTTLAALYSPPAGTFTVPASPTTGAGRKLGMWIYASPECYGNIWFRIQLFNPPGAAGSGSSVVAVWGNEPSYAGINWVGWKYHTFDFPTNAANKELGPPASTTPSYGMFRLLQEKSGNPEPNPGAPPRQLTKGYFIIDNVRVTTAAEDMTPPIISTLKGNNETDLPSGSGPTFTTNTINLSATFSDGGSLISGINFNSVHFIVDGNVYKEGDTGLSINQADANSGSISLTGLTLANGQHSVVAHVEDNFGHITTKTGTFIVESEDGATVTLEPASQALVGNIFEMKINTDNSKDIKELAIVMELQNGSVDAVDGITFASSVLPESNYNFNSSNGNLTINLKNDVDAGLVETLATIKVNIPKNSNPTDVFRCSPVTANATYANNSSSSFSLFDAFARPVLATYEYTVTKRVTGVPGEVLVKDLSGNPVAGATVYALTATMTPITSAVTDANGIASNMNFTSSAQSIYIYAEKDGKYSYTIPTLILEAKLTSAPAYIRSGTTVDPTSSKTITWMSNPATAAEPSIIKLAKESDGEGAFQQYTGTTKMLEFDATASSGVTKGSSVTVENLEPGTTYIYQIGDGLTWSPTRKFTTTTVTGKFSFGAFGDLQATSNAAMNRWLAAAETMQTMPEKPFFSINVGDIPDNDSRYDYHSYFGYLCDQREAYSNIDMVSTYGNHEYMGTPDAYIVKFMNGHPKITDPAYDAQLVGTGTYAVEYGNMLVIGLDWEARGPASANAIMTEQAKWMDDILSKTNKTWKIVTLHYPIFPSAFTSGSQTIYGPVFDKHDVQLVFCGHGHTYERVQAKGGSVTSGSNRRTFAPVLGNGTLHIQMGDMTSTGNQARWILFEVDGTTMTATVRNADNNVVENECFTLQTSAPNKHAVTFNVVNGNGTLTATVDGTGITTGEQVTEGKEVVFTATPNSGYHVKEWKLNNTIVNGTATTYTLSNLSAEATVTVEFELATGIENIFTPDLQIYPNPFVNELYITGAENCTLRVMNIVGTAVHIQKISGANEIIHLEQLPAGVYFFRLEKDGQSKTVKILKI